jgi:hypothetical protein
MSINDARICYLLTDPQDGRKLFVGPSIEILDGAREPTAELWADVYNGHYTLSSATSDVDGWAQILSYKEFVDDDEFDEETEKPCITLARVLRNGTVEIYDPNGELPENAAIPEGLEPGEIRKAEWLLDDFGMPKDMVAPMFGAGAAKCAIEIRIADRSACVDAFGKEPEDLGDENLREIFHPVADADTGFTLDEISLVATGDTATLTLSGQVTDPVLLQLSASMAGRASRRDACFVAEGVADAIFEVCRGADGSRSPDDYGFNMIACGEPAADGDFPEPGF